MKNNNLIRIFSAMLSLLVLVVCIGVDFSPAKYKGNFSVGNVGLTVEAEEIPAVTTVLEPGPTFNARIKDATTVTFGIATDYPQFTWGGGTPVDEDSSGGIQLFNDGTNYYVLCEDTIATGTDCSKMFYYCQNLTDIYGLERIRTDSATTMEKMFGWCTNLNNVNLSKLNTENVTSMLEMFQQCYALEDINLSHFNTENVTTMKRMFFQCTSVLELDVSGFDTSNVTDMEDMFYNMDSLTEIDVTNFKTGKVKKMTGLFSECDLLKTIDLSSFDTRNVTSMNSMFYLCKNLQSVDLSSFDTSSVTTMASMFFGCYNLKEVDMSSFSTPSLTNIDSMFGSCYVLKTVYVSPAWTIENVADVDCNVFEKTTNIVGGQGTTFDDAHIDGTYAIPDDIAGTGVPGYFTLNEYLYKIYYHSFDDEGNDYVWRIQGLHADDDVPAYSPPVEHSDLTFIGWSAQCQWIDPDTLGTVEPDDAYPASKLLKAKPMVFNDGEPITVSELLVNNEIHLYDLYEEYKLTIKGENLTEKTEINVWFAIANTKEELDEVMVDLRSDIWYFVIYGVQMMRRTSTDGSGQWWIAQSLVSDEFIHYIHPGSYVALRGNCIEDKTDSLEHYTNIYLNGEHVVNLYKNGPYDEIHTWCFGLESSTAVVKHTSSTLSSSGGSGSGGGGTCFATGTLITMADGTQVPVEEVKRGDLVRVYDHENGEYTTAPILFTEYEGDYEWPVTNLVFSDGTTQKFIFDHALFDLDLNEYVYITADNCQDYIGHRFAMEEDSGYSKVVLEGAWTELEYTGCYSMTTQYHLNYFVNGMFSMPGGIPGLFNFFEYDEDLKYDPVQMQRDIEKYGLFTYEDFEDYMPEEVFEQIFPIKYLTVSIGKGLTTFEDLERIIERYIYGHDLIEDFEMLPEEEMEEDTSQEEQKDAGQEKSPESVEEDKEPVSSGGGGGTSNKPKDDETDAETDDETLAPEVGEDNESIEIPDGGNDAGTDGETAAPEVGGSDEPTDGTENEEIAPEGGATAPEGGEDNESIEIPDGGNDAGADGETAAPEVGGSDESTDDAENEETAPEGDATTPEGDEYTSD